MSSAVFLPDEFEEEEVKYQDEKAYREPEDGGQTTQLVPMLVQRDHVMLVRRS
jgi:hypothetical protein